MKIYSDDRTSGRDLANGDRARFGEFRKVIYVDNRAATLGLWVARLDFEDSYNNLIRIVRLTPDPVRIENVRFTAAGATLFDRTASFGVAALTLIGLTDAVVEATFDRTWATGMSVQSCYGADVRARFRGILNWPGATGHGFGYGVSLNRGTGASRVRIDGRDCRHAFTTDFTDSGAFSALNWDVYGWCIDNVVSGHIVNSWGPAFDTHEFCLRTTFIDCHASVARPGAWPGATGEAAFSDRGCDTRYVGCTGNGAAVGFNFAGQSVDHDRPNLTTAVGCRSTDNRKQALSVAGALVGERSEADITGTTAGFRPGILNSDYLRGLGFPAAEVEPGTYVEGVITATNTVNLSRPAITNRDGVSVVVHQQALTLITGTKSASSGTITVSTEGRKLVAPFMGAAIIRANGDYAHIGQVADAIGTSATTFPLDSNATMVAVTSADILVLGTLATLEFPDAGGDRSILNVGRGVLGLRPGLLVRTPPQVGAIAGGSRIPEGARIRAITPAGRIVIDPPVTAGTGTAFVIGFAYPNAVEIEGGYWEADGTVVVAEEGLTRLSLRGAHLAGAAGAVESAADSTVLDQITITARADVAGVASPAIVLGGRAPQLASIAPRFFGRVGRFTAQVVYAATTVAAARLRASAAIAPDSDAVPPVPAASLRAVDKRAL